MTKTNDGASTSPVSTHIVYILKENKQPKIEPKTITVACM